MSQGRCSMPNRGYVGLKTTKLDEKIKGLAYMT